MKDRIYKLTEKEKEILINEGYTFINFVKIKTKNGKNETKMAIKHNLCGKEYLIRPSKFFKEEQRCSCQRKNTEKTLIKNTEDYQRFLDNNYNSEYKVISEYINRKSPIKLLHKCGYQYQIKAAEYLIEKGHSGGTCPVCTSRKFNSIEIMNLKFKNLGLKIEIDKNEVFYPGKRVFNIHDLNCGHIYKRSYLDILKNKKSNCPICQQKYRKDIDIEYVKNEFLKLDPSYTILSSKYEGTHKLLKVQHNDCQTIYSVSKTNFISGKRCPYCCRCRSFSKAELDVNNFINSLDKAEKREFYEKGKKKYEIDSYIDNKKLGIEYNGLYWHSDTHRINDYHINKFNYFNDQGVQLIQIFSDEWENKQDIVKDYLKERILNRYNNQIENYQINRISRKEKEIFLEKNYFYNIRGSHFYEIKNNNIRVGILVIKKENDKKFGYIIHTIGEIIEDSFIDKLKIFLKDININNINFELDLRWYNYNNIFSRNNIKLTSITKPNFFYLDKKCKIREPKSKYTRSKLKTLFPDIYSDSKSESEIMKEAGYSRIYDCGNLVYTLSL